MNQFWEWFCEREFRRFPESKPAPKARALVPMSDDEIKDLFYDLAYKRGERHYVLDKEDSRTWRGILAYPSRWALFLALIGISGSAVAISFVMALGTPAEGLLFVYLLFIPALAAISLRKTERFFALDSHYVSLIAVVERYHRIKTRRTGFVTGAEILIDRCRAKQMNIAKELDEIVHGWTIDEQTQSRIKVLQARIADLNAERHSIVTDLFEYENLQGELLQDLNVILVKLSTYDSGVVLDRAREVIDDVERSPDRDASEALKHFQSAASQLDELARKYRKKNDPEHRSEGVLTDK